MTAGQRITTAITTLDYFILWNSLHAAHIVGFKERGTNVIAAHVVTNIREACDRLVNPEIGVYKQLYWDLQRTPFHSESRSRKIASLMIVRHNGSREARCCASGRPLRERRTTSGKTLTLIGEKNIAIRTSFFPRAVSRYAQMKKLMNLTICTLVLSISLVLPLKLHAQNTDSGKIQAEIESYVNTYLSVKLQESTDEEDSSVSDFVMTNDGFVKALRDSLKNVHIDWPDYARGADLNVKYRNYAIQNLIHLDNNRVFLSLRLRKNIESNVKELQEGIDLLGRLRDNFYVILVLNKKNLHLSSAELVVNAYSELYFNKLEVSGRIYLWSLENKSSFGGDYSSFVLRVLDPSCRLREILEEEIYSQRQDTDLHADTLREIQIDRILKFDFLSDTLRIYGTEYDDGRDSTISQSFRIPH